MHADDDTEFGGERYEGEEKLLRTNVGEERGATVANEITTIAVQRGDYATSFKNILN